MPQSPDWKRVLETGMNFTEVHRSQAQKIASDLVNQGQLARDQLGAAVDEIVETSRRRSEELRKVVRAEVKRQLETLHLSGVVPFNLDDDEPKLRATKRAGTKSAPVKKQAAKKPEKKKAAKKATKKPAKAAAKKSPAKNTTAKKPAKKAAAKTTAAKKAPAKQAGAASTAKRAN